MKTEPYKVAHRWREKKKADGWKYFSKLVPPDVFKRLAAIYRDYKKQV